MQGCQCFTLNLRSRIRAFGIEKLGASPANEPYRARPDLAGAPIYISNTRQKNKKKATYIERFDK